MIGIDSAVQIFFNDTMFANTNISLDKFNEFDLKKVYREKVKLTHPDRAVILGRSFNDLEDDFKKVNDAYKVILHYYHSVVTVKPVFAKKEDYVYKRKETKTDDFSNKNDFKYSLNLPNRRLRLSEYLYYSKIITWNQLISSIVYQNSRRPKIGQIAVSLDYIDDIQLSIIIKNIRPAEKFGDAAIRLGFIDLYKLFVLLGSQRKYNAPIGRYFVDKRIISKERLVELLKNNRDWNMRF